MSKKLELEGVVSRHVNIDYHRSLELTGKDQNGRQYSHTDLNMLIAEFLSDERRCGAMSAHQVKITVEVNS